MITLLKLLALTVLAMLLVRLLFGPPKHRL